ncbi:ninja-family protein 6-like isoform X2 [Typha latifolia]|uniref:ninja-family protein 6-like isoform X2 n=1 Tax=Typha latifolia TaxID=4733 RepID=UPI003C2B57CF
MEGELQRLSSRSERRPRDLLRRFASNSSIGDQLEATGGDSDEIELSLGLSLNGCFGVDPKGKKLVRSSSIASLSLLSREKEFMVATGPLVRTSSLPAETDEEGRKRMELLSLKRLEAKRKRLERKNSIKSGSGKGEEDLDGFRAAATVAVKVRKLEVGIINGCDDKSLGGNLFGGKVNGVSPPRSLRAPPPPPPQPVTGFPPISQISIGSQGSNSFGISDFDTPQGQGINANRFSSSTEARSPPTFQALPETTNHRKIATNPPPTPEGNQNQLWRIAGRANSMGVAEKNMMEEMPCVSTKGDGPNGRKVEGFLYKYQKAEEATMPWSVDIFPCRGAECDAFRVSCVSICTNRSVGPMGKNYNGCTLTLPGMRSNSCTLISSMIHKRCTIAG